VNKKRKVSKRDKVKLKQAQDKVVPGGASSRKRSDTDRLGSDRLGPDTAMLDSDRLDSERLDSDRCETDEDRREVSRRSRLSLVSVKKVIQNASSSLKVPATFPIVMGAIAKLYVADLVRLATLIQRQWGHQGPLAPHHLHEAFRRLLLLNKIPLRFATRRLFKRRA